MPHPRRSLTAAVAAVAVVLVALAVPFAVAHLARPDGPPSGGVLDGTDRRALAPAPVRPGPPPLPVDPAVDLTDPAAVARAYLAVARSADADDRDRTHRQAAGYAAPGSPPATVGVLVLDPPPPGQVRTATVTALELVALDDEDQRRGYRATVATATGPPGAGPAGAVLTAYVVLARQPDGHWLVTTDTPEVPEGAD